ncbi:hypothetical protein HHI36_021177 [Cryptolaemus montrouzieri]|uniref:Nuclear pore complex protein Nup88 n=1 Tax=Cryptolaemus montrouzieri TaxID=559131 RepID=A0ABD2MW02_9CUCU
MQEGLAGSERLKDNGLFFQWGERTHSLDERLLVCSDSVDVLQVKFHPGSIKDNHILLLTSDNTLRLYRVEGGEVFNLGAFLVGDKPVAKVPCSKITFLGALGEIAVDFDFGHPELSGNKTQEEIKNFENDNRNSSLIEIRNPLSKSNTNIIVHQPEKGMKKNDKTKEKDIYSNFNWPVYVLSGDFIISVVNISLHEGFKSELRGPLPMTPSSVIQCDKRACSIICLNSSPQVVCIGSTNGEILHGVVLPFEGDTMEKKDIDLSTFINRNNADREIYFFEAVDIELGLCTTSQQQECYSCPIFLYKDCSRCDRYFVTHSAGVHTISIGCMENLQKDLLENTNDIFSTSSTPEYLVCTKTTTTKSCNPVVGFSVYYNPNSIITLLANGSLLSLALMNTSALPKLEKLTLHSEKVVESPIKEVLKMPFDQYIHNLLKKAESHPIIKLSRNEEHSLKECHELIQKTAQIFQEKFKCHTKAREEIEKRAIALKMLKEYQLKELDNMNKERRSLQEKAESLAEKYEDIREKQEVLMKRCAKLVVMLSLKKEILSDAEQEYLVDLKNMRGKLDKCDSSIEKLITKKSCQETQMRNWKNQQQKKSTVISDTHTNTIKESLVNSSIRINKMVAEIKAVKKQLHLK